MHVVLANLSNTLLVLNTLAAVMQYTTCTYGDTMYHSVQRLRRRMIMKSRKRGGYFILACSSFSLVSKFGHRWTYRTYGDNLPVVKYKLRLLKLHT